MHNRARTATTTPPHPPSSHPKQHTPRPPSSARARATSMHYHPAIMRSSAKQGQRSLAGQVLIIRQIHGVLPPLPGAVCVRGSDNGLERPRRQGGRAAALASGGSGSRWRAAVAVRRALRLAVRRVVRAATSAAAPPRAPFTCAPPRSAPPRPPLRRCPRVPGGLTARSHDPAGQVVNVLTLAAARLTAVLAAPTVYLVR